MKLSDVSIRRPVLASMLSLALDTGRPDVDAHAMGLSLYRVAPGAAAAFEEACRRMTVARW